MEEVVNIEEVEARFFQCQPLSNVDLHDLILEVKRLRNSEKMFKILVSKLDEINRNYERHFRVINRTDISINNTLHREINSLKISLGVRDEDS